MKRIDNLDYLRGLAAFGIMIYHYCSWEFGNFSSGSFLGRTGVYGVSIFYVLSGLTLYYVYSEKMMPFVKGSVSFFVKRFFRIFPLLWLVTGLTILLSHKFPSPGALLLNLTGVFGVVQWDSYIGTGVWSIGNELVFYLFFPVFILLSARKHISFYFLQSVLLGIYLYFAFFRIDPAITLNDQWREYTNPMNQIFLFSGGFLIGHWFSRFKIDIRYNIPLLFASLALYTFYPVSGDDITLVTGSNRVLFTLLSFIICICFFKNTIILPRLVHIPLKLLGEASYSVYLIHPLVWTSGMMAISYLKKHGIFFSSSLIVSLCITATIFISWMTHAWFERYFMGIGRKIAGKFFP